jgi:hypothetical protein
MNDIAENRLGTPCRFCGSWAMLCRLRYMRFEKIEVAGKVNLVHCCARCQNHGAADAHRKEET